MSGEELKHALMNYHQIYKWWEVNDVRIQAIIYEMEGVKGIRYDKEISKGGSPINFDEKMLNFIKIKDELIVSSKHYAHMVEEVHNFIAWLEEPFKTMVSDKYIGEMCNTKLEHKYNYSSRGIQYIIDGLVSKYYESFP